MFTLFGLSQFPAHHPPPHSYLPGVFLGTESLSQASGAFDQQPISCPLSQCEDFLVPPPQRLGTEREQRSSCHTAPLCIQVARAQALRLQQRFSKASFSGINCPAAEGAHHPWEPCLSCWRSGGLGSCCIWIQDSGVTENGRVLPSWESAVASMVAVLTRVWPCSSLAAAHTLRFLKRAASQFLLVLPNLAPRHLSGDFYCPLSVPRRRHS